MTPVCDCSSISVMISAGKAEAGIHREGTKPVLLAEFRLVRAIDIAGLRNGLQMLQDLFGIFPVAMRMAVR